MSGKSRRLNRLFRHGNRKAVLTPIDHGLWYGPMAGIERPLEVTRKVISGSDGLLVAPGFACALGRALPSDRALAVRVGAATDLGPVQDYETVFASVETALRIDADAVVHTLYLGGAHDDRAIRDLGQIIEQAGRYDLPVLAEFLPSQEDWTWEQVAHWARFGFELGADMIKTIYTGNRDSFEQVTEGCPLPILIAGGPRTGSLGDLLRMVADALDAGAAGTAMGRQVWQTQDPEWLLGILSRLVHEEIDLSQALQIIESEEE